MSLRIRLKVKRNAVYQVVIIEKREIWVATGLKAKDVFLPKKGLKGGNNRGNFLNPAFESLIIEKRAFLLKKIALLEYQNIPIVGELLREPKKCDIPAKALSEEFKEYLRLREHSISYYTVKKLNQLTEKLDRFENTRSAKLTKDSFNRATFQEFTQFLSRNDKLADNTIAAHVYALKGFLKFVNPDVNYDYIKFSEKYYNVFYLEPEEMEVLKNAKGLPPYLEKPKDIFLIAYYSGVRYSDLKQIRLDNLSGGLFRIMMQKTNTYCYPPLMPELEVLLKKYDGKCPKESNQRLNEYLKILFRRLELTRMVMKMTRKGPNILKEPMELCDVVTMHVARKTFIMTLVAKGYQRDDIIHMTGHSTTKALDPYITILESRVKQINNQLRLGGVL